MASAISILDGQMLDTELERSLLGRLDESLADITLPISLQRLKTNYGVEMKTLLRLALFKLLIWDRSTTYGLSIQNLKLSASTWQKIGLLVTIISGYLATKLESNIYARDGDDPVFDLYVRRIKPVVDKLGPVVDLLISVQFLLRSGSNAPSNLAHGLLGVSYAKTQHLAVSGLADPQNVSYEFQNRQLIWNAVTETLKLAQLWQLPQWVRKWQQQQQQPETKAASGCAFCHSDICYNEIAVTPCGCRFCYLCFFQAASRGQLQCICGQHVTGLRIVD